MEITERQVVDLVSDLVRIESVTPWLVPGGAGEVEVERYIADWLSDLPVEVMIDEFEAGRANLLARLRGTGNGPTLCINAHADTVGYANWADEALKPRRDGYRLYGLGAADDKAGCAAALLTLRAVASSGSRLSGDLLVALVADEEGASAGTERLIAHQSIDAAIVIEPGDLSRVIVEHQGFGWIDIIVIGKAAHGSAPDQGVDAIVLLAEIITRLHRHDATSFVPHPHPRNGRTAFHTSTVHGGTDYATYPSRAELGVEIGTQPGEHLSDRVREIEAIFSEVRISHPELQVEMRVRMDREPFEAKGHERLYDVLDSAALIHLGHHLEPAGLNAWTDAALMQQAGIPTVLFGPRGGNIHAPDEWVDIPEVVALCAVLEDSVRAFLV